MSAQPSHFRPRRTGISGVLSFERVDDNLLRLKSTELKPVHASTEPVLSSSKGSARTDSVLQRRDELFDQLVDLLRNLGRRKVAGVVELHVLRSRHRFVNLFLVLRRV